MHSTVVVLPGTVGADQADDPAGRYIEVQAVDHHPVAVTLRSPRTVTTSESLMHQC